MRNLQIIGNVPQVRRESNFGEYAEEAVIIEEQPKVKKENPHFLEANTLEVTMQHLKEDCITPVFAKDNELTIPHPAFIDTVYDAANTFFSGESIDKPDIRVSHIIKGRIPEAIHKPANQLLESDKTIYYERCAFIIQIPTIYETVNGNKLTLTIGGVRAYNHTNLYSKKGAERFKVFIGAVKKCYVGCFDIAERISRPDEKAVFTDSGHIGRFEPLEFGCGGTRQAIPFELAESRLQRLFLDGFE